MIEPMRRQYELMVVFAPTVEEKKLEDGVKKLVGEGAAVGEVKVLGKKPLAYPINKQTEGVYVLVTVSAEALHVSDIEKRMKVGTDVLRYLLTVKEGQLSVVSHQSV